jgi:hypothetical protein
MNVISEINNVIYNCSYNIFNIVYRTNIEMNHELLNRMFEVFNGVANNCNIRNFIKTPLLNEITTRHITV